MIRTATLLILLLAQVAEAQMGASASQLSILDRLTAAGTEADRPDVDDPEAAWPNVQDPGPDLANFPNAAFTIPRGAVHFEFAPVGLYGPEENSPPTFTTEYLLRYGVTDRLELRLFGNGYQSAFNVRPGLQGGSGFAPIAFDAKVNLWDQDDETIGWPSVGLEVFIQTEFASRTLRQGTQSGMSLLFDHALPARFQFEWNVGVNTLPEEPGGEDTEWNLQWALQRRFFDRLDIFTHGYLNSATLPRSGDGIVIGGGAIYNLSERLSVFGSYNAGLTRDAPTTFFQIGSALAF